MTIDADALRRSVSLPDLVARYTELKQRGREYVGCCPFHHDSRPSLQLFEGRDQVWRWWCPPCAETGDCIDFLMQAENLEFPEACRRLGARDLPEPRHIVPPPPSVAVEDWRPIVPVPADAPPMDLARIWNPKKFVPATGECGAYVRYRPVFHDAYESPAGLHGYVARLEFTDAAGERVKIPTPITYCEDRSGARRWCAVKLAAPRPLLGLLDLLARTESPVLVVSGEKCYRAAKRRLPSFVVVTWAGGDNAWSLTDWTPLVGRRVVWWPDADDSGRDSMHDIAAAAGAVQNRHIRTDELPKGFDVADVDESENLVDYCKGRVTEGAPPLSEKERGKREREKAKEVMRSERKGDAGNTNGQTDPEAGRLESPEAKRPERAASGAPREPNRKANGHKHPNAPPDAPPPIIPFDLFSKPILPSLRAEWLPPALAPFIFDQAAIVGGDPGVLAIAALTMCATVIDDRIKLRATRHSSWTESARIWGVSVGEPASKKTPTMMRAVKHVVRMDADVAAASERAQAQYERAKRVFDKLEQKWVAAEASGRTMGTAPEPPEKPARLRYLVGDATVEAVSQILEGNARGIGVWNDELMSWIGSMDAYKQGSGGKDRALWLEFYNGDERTVDRVTGGTRRVPSWGGCVLGGIQPSRFRTIVDKIGSDGLLQRFIVVMAEVQPDGGCDRAEDARAERVYVDTLRALAAEPPPAAPLSMSDGALRVRERVEAELRMLSTVEHLPEGLRVQLGKWDGLFVRLCLLYHMIEQVQGMSPTGVNPVVAEQTALRVEQLMQKYLLHHSLAFYDEVMEVSDRARVAKEVAALILEKRFEEVSRRDVTQLCKPYRKCSEWQKRETMRMLEDAGWMFPIVDHPGRQPNKWAVNPLVHSMFESYAARAEERTRERAAKLQALGFRVGGQRVGA